MTVKVHFVPELDDFVKGGQAEDRRTGKECREAKRELVPKPLERFAHQPHNDWSRKYLNCQVRELVVMQRPKLAAIHVEVVSQRVYFQAYKDEREQQRRDHDVVARPYEPIKRCEIGNAEHG